MNFSNNPILYIPFEVKIRDLLPRTYLALKANQMGYNVVLGYRFRLEKIIDSLPQGIYFDRSLAAPNTNFIGKLKKNGFRHYSNDVEGGGVYDNEKIFSFLRVGKKNLDYTHRYFAWFKKEEDIIGQLYPEKQKKIVHTGSPRLDILKSKNRQLFEKKSNSLQKKYGKIILVNLSVFLHHKEGEEFWEKQVKKFKQKLIENGGNEEDVKNWMDHINRRRRSSYKLIKDIIALADKFEKYTFIIRNHPSGDLDKFKGGFKDLPRNVILERDGSVIPWIMASECVIHNYCTTAIESFALDKFVICYDHKHQEDSDNILSGIVSEVVANRKELLESLKKGVFTKSQLSQKRQIFNEETLFYESDASEKILYNITAKKNELNNLGMTFFKLLKFKIMKLRWGKEGDTLTYNELEATIGRLEEILDYRPNKIEGIYKDVFLLRT